MWIGTDGFVEGSNGVEICATAIVFRHVASQCLICIGRGQDQEKSIRASEPRQQLTETETDYHTQTRLNVLQGQILTHGTAHGLKSRRLSAKQCKNLHDCSHGNIDVDVDMIAANLSGQICSSVTRNGSPDRQKVYQHRCLCRVS